MDAYRFTILPCYVKELEFRILIIAIFSATLRVNCAVPVVDCNGEIIRSDIITAKALCSLLLSLVYRTTHRLLKNLLSLARCIVLRGPIVVDNNALIVLHDTIVPSVLIHCYELALTPQECCSLS